MDYVEEQQSEIEALESIYPSEFTLLSDEPISFSISVKSENYDIEREEGLCCIIKFTFTPTYPEEVPEIEILEDTDEEEYETNLEPEDIIDLKELIVQEASENTGMAMCFTVVSAALEWLNVRSETLVKERDDEQERKKKEEDEAEQHRFDGTRVTVTSFIEWKSAFDEEMKKKKTKEEIERERDLSTGKKLTGKELFLRDKTLNESDLQFVEEGDVPIDESLFDDLEDLDLEGGDDD